MPNHYKDPISNDPNRVGGLSRRAGDATIETKELVIAKIISYGNQYGLSSKDIANLIAFAKIESGFNPDAAAKGSQTSASGVFQITDSTARDATKRLNGKPRVNGIDSGEYNRFDVDSNIKFGIQIYLDKKSRANSDNAYDIYKAWNSNPEEYQKYKKQLEIDSNQFETHLKQNKKIVDLISTAGHNENTTNEDPEYLYLEGEKIVRTFYRHTTLSNTSLLFYEDFDSDSNILISLKRVAINGNFVETRSDKNGDGAWDSFDISIDKNHDGFFDSFISTGHSLKSMFDADRQLQALYTIGLLGSGFWNDYVDWSTSQLITNNLYSLVANDSMPDLSPIGAFYESASAAHDPAGSIAGKTIRILDAVGRALSASQLAALDRNADGQLSGAEINGLTAWRDANENGVLDAAGEPELVSAGKALEVMGKSSIRSTDYAFLTSGNANYRRPEENRVAAPVNTLAAPVAPAAALSNYTALRTSDNRFTLNSIQWIDWAADQVKISSDQRNMVGTDGADTFDIAYYAAYDGQYFNLGLVQNFYAGGGDDFMGGSTRNDSLWGGAGNDLLLGYEGDDRLYGEEGNDNLEGRTGNDLLHGGAGNDVLFGQDGNDIVAGADGNDELQGGAGQDTLNGGTGDDKLFGQVGNDMLAGDDGNDILVGFTPSNDAKQALSAGETDDDMLYGGNGADEMWGGLGNDMLDGGMDADLLVGGDGVDTLLGGHADDELHGGAGNDILDGGTGTDKMFGCVGNDQMWGGDGDDILLGFTPGNDDKQTLASGETDDDLLRGGTGNDLMLGDLGNDLLWGGAGNDELNGGDGADGLYGEEDKDRMFGGAGDDILYGGDGDDILLGFTASNDSRQTLLAGETDDDLLYGGAGNDVLLGGLGNDYLDGGAGADDMEGGQGNDTYIVNSVNDVVLEQQDEGYDIVTSSVSAILHANVEELRLVEGYAINGTGNRLNNTLLGNSLDNILDGVTGADRMTGGAGNDTYYVDNAGDQTIEFADEGIDTVCASIDSYLRDNMENLTLLDFSMPEKGIADGRDILVYGYPKAFELDYMQGDAVAGFAGTCALTAIANLGTQANQALSEAQVVQRAIDNHWAVADAASTDYQRGGSNYAGQQALLDSYGLRNGIIMGYNEQAIANLLKGGRGVIIGVNAGKLWGDSAYLDNGGVNHVVTVTGVACDSATGDISGFYIADSGRGKVSDMTRYIPIADFRADVNVANAYAIYTIEPIKLWNEDIHGAGNSLDNVLIGNRGNNNLDGWKGNDILMGGAGNDRYVIHAGDGQDTIIETDVTPGNSDTLHMVHARQTNLWFSHVGNDLRIDVMGTSDRITVKDWYTEGAGMPVEHIHTADGLVMNNTDVEQLVQAMAAFAPPAPGQTSWTPGQASNGQVLLTVMH